MTALSVTDFTKKLTKLNERLASAKIVIESSARTKRQLAINIQHLHRLIANIEQYTDFEPSDNKEVFEYAEMTTDPLDTAAEYLIELNGYLQEMEEDQHSLTSVASSAAKAPQVQHVQPVSCNIKVTVPKFKGDYSEYPKFRAIFNTAMNADRKSNPERLRALEQHLEGRPLTLISNLDYETGFEEAMQILDETFDVKARQQECIMNKIRRLPRANDSLISLRETFETLEALLRALQSYTEIDGKDEIRKLVMSKYPAVILDRISPTEIPTLQVIRDRIKRIVRAKEDVEAVFESLSDPAPNVTQESSMQVAVMHSGSSMKSSTAQENTAKKSGKTNPTSCIFCTKNNHRSEECRTFPTASSRVAKLPPYTCHRCLQTGHILKNCSNTSVKCKICDRPYHNTALCPTRFGYFKERPKQEDNSTKKPQQKITTPKETVKTTVGLVTNLENCYLTARAQIRNPDTGVTMNVRVFLDCGCNRTFILQDTAKQLQLTAVNSSNLAVTLFLRPEVEEIRSEIVKFQLLSPLTAESYDITAHTVPRITDDVRTYNASEFRRRYPQYEHLQLADEGNDEEIAILIGNNHLWKFILPETKIELDLNLYIIKTLFGWMIVGNHQTESNATQGVKSFHASTKYVTALWSLDTIGITDKNLSNAEEEQIAIEQFNATIRYIPTEKRYEVGLPCRTLRPEIPTNFALAKAILTSLLRKYRKHPEYLEACSTIFKEQLEAGIIERVTNGPHEDTHYIPYHWIERPGKSTPIRIVYNASAKSSRKQLSLNDTLYKGANLLNDMLGILIRLRFQPIAVTADIAKAFHQVTLHPVHRDYVRFLWMEDPINEDSSKLVTYRFRRLPFGVISSPFILAATILYHLNKYTGETAKRIRKDIYADNIITTFSTESEAMEFYHESRRIFDEASMPLRQWQTNSNYVRQNIEEKLRDKNTVITVLGIRWEIESDVLSICVPPPITDMNTVTMLQVLQLSSQVYDPLSWFAPVTIRSRMLLQKLHARSYAWETSLNESEMREWHEIFSDLQQIKNFEIRRNIYHSLDNDYSVQYHVFTDASKAAYAAAVYIRTETKTQVKVHLLMGKSRVTPLNAEDRLTIPRLELMAAVIGKRILMKVIEALNVNEKVEIFHWIDSRCVLAWLHTNAALPTFVRNRVREIKELAHVQYRYVPSEFNPADLASRGIPIVQLHEKETLWWHGPKWLSREVKEWPTPPSITSLMEPGTKNSAESVMTVTETQKKTSPFGIEEKKYVSYLTLIRTTALCIHFLRKHSSEKVRQLFPNNDEASISYAKRIWIKNAQEDAFADVILLLQQNRTSTMIKKLRLFLDPRGIIRSAGRFHYALLTYEEKNPILLPKPLENHMVRLLILHTHNTEMHAGVAITLAAFRKRYWIPSGRKQTAAVLRKCHACRKDAAKPYQQPEESVLPPFRLRSKLEAFSHVGLDVVGHFWVRKHKRWILVVTCLVTRAIALEDLENLETETVMLALQRIQARTATSVFYLSDNAPQFVLIKSIIEKNATEQFQWKFLPAFMPWAGGVYERLMKLVKASLNATFRAEVNVSDTQFRTIVQRITAILNQRPLTFQGEEFDGTPLTPNNLLKIHFSSHETDTLITSADSNVSAYLKHNMKMNREIENQFWNRWSHDYLQFLRERSATFRFKKKTNRFAPKIGDVVLLHDPVLKQRNWHLAVVHQLQRSDDNSIRSAVVRLGTGTKVVRPVEKLYYMELNEFEDQGEPIPLSDSHNPSAGIENIIIPE